MACRHRKASDRQNWNWEDSASSLPQGNFLPPLPPYGTQGIAGSDGAADAIDLQASLLYVESLRTFKARAVADGAWTASSLPTANNIDIMNNCCAQVDYHKEIEPFLGDRLVRPMIDQLLSSECQKCASVQRAWLSTPSASAALVPPVQRVLYSARVQ